MLLSASLLAGCVTTKPDTISDGASETGTESKTRSSAPYSSHSNEVKPVYILPRFEEGFVPPGINDQGEYHGGYTVVTQVEPGRMATQDEAEQMGLPYIISGRDATIPTPMAAGGPPQELNATTVAQKLAGVNAPSQQSVSNQVPRTNTTPPPQSAQNPPPLDDIDPAPTMLPGLNSTSSKPSSKRAPSAQYNKKRKTLTILPGGKDGDNYQIPTPRGPVGLSYQDGQVLIVFDKKTTSTAAPTNKPITIQLP